MIDYELLIKQLEAVTEGVEHPVSNLANASALIWDALPEINWAGFYLLEGEKLILGPFQGKVACVTIPVGRGVCGASGKENATMLVPDVHAFPGHIACDCASNSEIVVPLRKEGKVIGVLDIDSPKFDRFSESDKDGLEKFAMILQQRL